MRVSRYMVVRLRPVREHTSRTRSIRRFIAESRNGPYRSVQCTICRLAPEILGTKIASVRYMPRSTSLPRLRLLVKHPKGMTGLLPRVRGRPPAYTPLLVAMDEICRRGIERLKNEDDGFVRPLSLKRGRRSAKMVQTASEALITQLARDWSVSEASVEEYLRNDDRFYYPRALVLMNKLLRLQLSPPLELGDVGRAISEHQPKNRNRKQPPLASHGAEFDLHPWIYKPHQRSKQSPR